MPTFRTEKTSDYAVIAKHHLRNKTLSYKAKGLLTFMLSVPPEWDWSLIGLAALSSDGIDGVRSGIRELERHGYLTRRRIRDPSGRLGDTEYTIHEIPQATDGNIPNKPPDTQSEPISEIPTLEKPTQEKPTLDLPILDLPILEKPTQEKTMQLSNKELNNKENEVINQWSNKEINGACATANEAAIEHPPLFEDTVNQHSERLPVETAQGADNSVYHAMTIVEQQFEEFWKCYPRKAGKKAAKKAWLAIAPDEPRVTAIMSALCTANRYWQINNISQRHIPHPSTWLNEERWEDEYTTEQLQGGEHGENYRIGGINDPYRNITQI